VACPNQATVSLLPGQASGWGRWGAGAMSMEVIPESNRLLRDNATLPRL